MGLKNRKNRNSKTLFDSNKISKIHGFHQFPGIVMVLVELFLFVCTRVPNYEGLYTKMMIFRNFVWVKNHLRVNIFRIFHFQKNLLIRQNWQVKVFFFKMCRDPGLNQGPSDLQSDALPTELSRLARK